QVLVPAVDERGRPGAVDVPEQDPHAGTSRSSGTSRSTAATTCSTVTSSRQGWPGTGQVRAREPAQAASCRPSSRCGTFHGRQRTAGTTGANSDTTGV